MGWIWILSGLAAIYFFIVAIAFNGRWSPFFWAVFASAISKWLFRGFEDSKKRVTFEAELISRGISKKEAGQVWLQAYLVATKKCPESKQIDGFCYDALENANNLVNKYSELLSDNSQIIFSEETLPASKEDIKLAIIQVVQAAKSLGQMTPQLLEHFIVAYASLANFVAPEDAEIARLYYKLTEEITDERKNSDEYIKNIANRLKDLPYTEILRRSNEEFNQLLKESETAIGR